MKDYIYSSNSQVTLYLGNALDVLKTLQILSEDKHINIDDAGIINWIFGGGERLIMNVNYQIIPYQMEALIVRKALQHFVSLPK